MLEILSVTGATRVTRRLKFSCVSLYNDNKILLNLENYKLVSTRHLNLTYKWGRGLSLNWCGGGGGCIFMYMISSEVNLQPFSKLRDLSRK